MVPTLAEITRGLRLDQPGRRVLIVEDSDGFARALAAWVAEAGHEVTLLAGVDEIVGDEARGRDIDLERVLAVDLRQFDAAFLDHYFLSKTYNGASLTRELLMRIPMLPIVAMSSEPSANRRMVEQGARFGIRKADLGTLIRHA